MPVVHLKGGRKRLAFQADHVTGLETRVVLTARLLTADAADGETLVGSMIDDTENIMLHRVADADACGEAAAREQLRARQ